MKYGRVLNPFACGCAVLFAFAASAKDIPLSKCPPGVQATIRSHAQEGKIEEVESLTIQGRRMFIAEVDLSGDRDLKIYVLANGTFFTKREEIRLDDTPIKVREAAQKLVPPKCHIDDVTKTSESDGKETYEVEIERRNSGDMDIVFSADGTFISRKEKSKD